MVGYDKALLLATDATKSLPEQRWAHDRKLQLDIVNSKIVDVTLVIAE